MWRMDSEDGSGGGHIHGLGGWAGGWPWWRIIDRVGWGWLWWRTYTIDRDGLGRLGGGPIH